MIDQSVINAWKKDLSTISKQEQIRIISGELNCGLFRAIKADIKKKIEQYGVRLKIIAGPVISVEPESGTNAILELEREYQNHVEVWISPSRQLSHLRIFDFRLVSIENYHEALDIFRKGDSFNDIIIVSKYVYDFNNLIYSLKLPKSQDCKPLLTAPAEKILEIKNKLGKLYDIMSAKELQPLLATS